MIGTTEDGNRNVRGRASTKVLQMLEMGTFARACKKSKEEMKKKLRKE